MRTRRPQDPWQIVQQSVRHWYWMPLTVLALGLASLLLLVGSRWIRTSLLEEDVRLVRSVGEIQTQVALSHLWIEELVTGDAVEPRSIEGHLETARQLAGNVERRLSGGRGRWFSRPPAERTLPSAARRAVSQLEAFAALTEDRRRGHEAGREVGIGSPVDREYDRVFLELMSGLRGLEAALDDRLLEAERRSAMVQNGVLAGWSLIVALAVTGLWTRERRRQRAEAALRDSQVQLLQAQKMEAVGRLAGGIAHDINNYLAAINAQCELVRLKAADNEAIAVKMDAVLATAARASALIRQLLAFSRRQPARPEPVDLNRTVRGMEKMLHRLLGEDVRLSTRLAPDLWSVEIDLSQAEQVLLNLAVNAREAMPRGGQLEIETANRPGAGGRDQVTLTVRDTGSGIDPRIQDKVFEPFFTTKDPSSSSGLGLSTVLGIVEQNGGEVGLESAPGAGTAVEIRLPRGARPATPPVETAREPAGAGSERILLVEDNRELRESTRQILQAWGYEVEATGEPERAIEAFRSDPPAVDLLITDLVMPGMSGKSLAERLRRLRPDLPVLFISGHADDVVLRHGIEAGEERFLQKPFDGPALAKAIREAMQG